MKNEKSDADDFSVHGRGSFGWGGERVARCDDGYQPVRIFRRTAEKRVNMV
jgi:hypothetical protein